MILGSSIDSSLKVCVSSPPCNGRPQDRASEGRDGRPRRGISHARPNRPRIDVEQEGRPSRRGALSPPVPQGDLPVDGVGGHPRQPRLPPLLQQLRPRLAPRGGAPPPHVPALLPPR